MDKLTIKTIHCLKQWRNNSSKVPFLTVLTQSKTLTIMLLLCIAFLGGVGLFLLHMASG